MTGGWRRWTHGEEKVINDIMTYKLNPIIEKVCSPVVLMLPGNETREYRDGKSACADTFNRNYQIKSISAEGSTVIIRLAEAVTPETTWIGEEQSFF